MTSWKKRGGHCWQTQYVGTKWCVCLGRLTCQLFTKCFNMHIFCQTCFADISQSGKSEYSFKLCDTRCSLDKIAASKKNTKDKSSGESYQAVLLIEHMEFLLLFLWQALNTLRRQAPQFFLRRIKGLVHILGHRFWRFWRRWIWCAEATQTWLLFFIEEKIEGNHWVSLQFLDFWTNSSKTLTMRVCLMLGNVDMLDTVWQTWVLHQHIC